MSLKLYVWVNPYPVRYGSSMVFAVADNIADARREAAKGVEWKFGSLGSGASRDWSAIKLGKPDRIVPVPVAEWHEWSE